jgi:hypothetical protein
MEAFLVSLGPPIVKGFTGLSTIQENLMFLGVMAVYTYVYLLYRCKYKTEKKPEVSIKKAIGAMTPLIIYCIALFVMLTILQYRFQPQIFIVYNLASLTLALWIVSFVLYYPALRLSHGDCFPSILGGIWNWIKGIFS